MRRRRRAWLTTLAALAALGCGGGAALAGPEQGGADELLLAQRRLARGDVAMAAPLFARLAKERRQEQPSEQAASLARGLLTCSVARGDLPQAAAALLRWRSLRRKGFVGTAAGAVDALDESAGLAPNLSPLLLLPDDPRAVALLEALEPVVEDDPAALALRLAAAGAQRRPGDATAEKLLAAARGAQGEDAALLAQTTLAVFGAPEQRGQAREWLRKRLMGRSHADWRSCWLRMALGRSLLLEQDEGQRREGTLQLLTVAARWSQALPEHARAATALAATALASMRQEQDARALARELERDPAAAVERRWLLARLRQSPEETGSRNDRSDGA